MVGAREILETCLKYLSWISLALSNQAKGLNVDIDVSSRRQKIDSVFFVSLYGGNLYNFLSPVEKSRQKIQNPITK